MIGMSFLRTIFKWLSYGSRVARRQDALIKKLTEEVTELQTDNDALIQKQTHGNLALLLARYNLSRMKLMETGGFLDVDVAGLADSMGFSLTHPKTIRDEVYAEFGKLGLADSADRMLTGDIYEEERKD